MERFDLLAIGDATVDIFLGIDEKNNLVSFDEEKNAICFPSERKIPVDSSEYFLGGIACNVAVGISRLGFKSALCAETGDDQFAKTILQGLTADKVDTRFFRQTKDARASFAVNINVDQERLLFVYHVRRAHKFDVSDLEAKLIYLASMGKDWHEAYETTLAFVESKNMQLAFTPGSAQLLSIDDCIQRVLKRADIVILNSKEARILLSSLLGVVLDEDEKSVSEMLSLFHKFGPKIAVITRGEKGSCAIDKSGKKFFLGTILANSKDRTGAGDSYTAGFLGALLSGESVYEAMHWGTFNAASVIQRVGAQTGLLTREELEKKLQEHPEFREKEL